MKTTTVFGVPSETIKEVPVVALVDINTTNLPESVPDTLLAIIGKDPLMVIVKGIGWSMVVDEALPWEERPNYLRWGDDVGWVYVQNGQPEGWDSHYYLEIVEK